MEKVYLTEMDCAIAARTLVRELNITSEDIVFGIPRGGWPVVTMINTIANCGITFDIKMCSVIVDDIIDSGETMLRTLHSLPPGSSVRHGALITRNEANSGKWFVFPWEGTEQASARDIVVRTLEYIGEDPKRDGLLETPERVLKAWGEIFSGYGQDPKALLKTFENEAQYDEMILLRNCEYYSTCEHHMVPFFGQANIAYIPSPEGRVIGISKLARLLDVFAKRLQIQERLTKQIADFLMQELNALGVAVMIEGQHLCMLSRGIRKQNSIMTTSAMLGIFRENSAARSEFFSLINRQ